MPRLGNERGQSLVVFAIFLTVLLGFVAVAVDAGRFYAERRFLQNAADAAALAAATALTQGQSEADAETLARATIQRNITGEPTGSAAEMPATVAIYAAGHTGEPEYLVEGILIDGTDVRVALRNDVGYTFGRAVGMTTQEISARAHASTRGDLLPIAVREFIKLPGPNINPSAPCSGSQGEFEAVFATLSTSCLGSSIDPTGQAEPTAGDPFDSAHPDSDPSHHGPTVEILGQGSAPGNAADFRGFIALDVRNFSTTSSQRYYNGATSSSSENSLKGLEAGWINNAGYPGPPFALITTPPDPMDQVAILSGNSAGLSVSAMSSRLQSGDEILVAVYPGYTMSIPDFNIALPPPISVPTSGTTATAGTFKVSRNQAFSGSITLTTLADASDPNNPLTLGTLVDNGSPIDFDPNPVFPGLGQGTSVTLRNITTTGAARGIYALWVNGQAGQPYLTAKQQPMSLNVGSVTRDFALSADASGKVAVNSGDSVTFALTLQNSPVKNTNFGGPVTLLLDGPLPPGIGAVSLAPTTLTPSSAGATASLTIGSGTLSQGNYRFVVRATGMNGDTTPAPVTHLLTLDVNVAPSGSPGSDTYIDLSGFSVMRITSISSNSVSAYAITPVIADPNDPRLRRGQHARLEPW